jgi:hypothetical protein
VIGREPAIEGRCRIGPLIMEKANARDLHSTPGPSEERNVRKLWLSCERRVKSKFKCARL